jgi:hypothetical protein
MGFPGGPRRLVAVIAALATAALSVSLSPALANVPLTRVSNDPFTNASSQHATELEPDTFAFRSTVVAAYQVGRFFNGGASDIGFARSTDGGATWGTSSFLPGLTFNAGSFGDPGSPYERVSDPSVAYDAKHHTWMVSSIPLLPSTAVPTVFVSLSTDGGRTFADPVQIPAPSQADLDKNWTGCDNHRHSPFYGNCYTEFDNFGRGDLEYVSTSSDGGHTWGAPVTPAGNVVGLGGQPVVQPNGTVIVPFETNGGRIAAFRSTDGGATWSNQTSIAIINFHSVSGNLRTSPLPTAETDRGGKVYVAWEDCRFEPSCNANDIVFSSSRDGLTWSAVRRVPIDAVGSGVDHFIPGLGVDPTTHGAGAHLALTYYYYPQAACTAASCRLDVGFISSPDGGATWSAPTALAGPMSLADIASTSQGPMVGDYISTSFNDSGTASAVFAIGKPHSGAFREAMWAPTAPLPVASAAEATRPATSAGAARAGGVTVARPPLKRN